MEELLTVLPRIPALAGVAPDALRAERMGGLTNLVYKVESGGEPLVVRIPGKGTEDYIDRKVEGVNARVAAEAGVSAELLQFDQDGLMVSRYLDGCETMTPESFRGKAGAPARAADAFKRMHNCGRDFEFRFELFAMIDDYLGHLDKLGAGTLPEGYHEVVKEAEAVRRILQERPGRLAPCHCDPLCENFLDDGERMWIVDWEYSGMNDPIWDLGDLSVEAGFAEEHDREMMAAYCGGAVPAATFGRMVIYKAMCDLLWTLWGLIQHANENPVEDFWAYAVNRFERCKALMGSDGFGAHLEAVRSSPDR